MTLSRTTAFLVASLLALPAAAFAQTGTPDGYSDGGDVVETVAEPAPEPTPSVASESSSSAPAKAAPAPKVLARTGSDEVIVGLAGLMLLGSGFAMRRVAR